MRKSANPNNNSLRANAQSSNPDAEKFKICFVGSQCGKSSIIMRLLLNEFANIDDPTIEDSHYLEFEFEGQQYSVELLDTAGNESYSYLYEKWFTWADGFVLVYSITSAFTFDMVPLYKERINQFYTQTAKVPICLIGGQADRRDSQEVSEKEGQSLAFKFGCLFTELSAKTSSQQDIRRVIVDLIGEIKTARKIEEIQQINGQKKTKKKENKKVINLDNARKMGVMNMTKKESFKGFKKVWCALKDGVLYIFTQEKDFKARTPKLAENLSYCAARNSKPPKQDKYSYFELIVRRDLLKDDKSHLDEPHQVETVHYWFQLENEEEKADWLSLIEYNVNLYIKKDADVKERLRHGGVEGGAAALKEIQSIPENRVCADCNSPNPDWVIEYIGAVVCIQCAGVHRNISDVHKTHVKSVMLDHLDSEVVMLTTVLGNKNVNSIWEANVPNELLKPNPSYKRKEKETFIKAKYIDKLFVHRENFYENSSAVFASFDLKTVITHPVGRVTFRKFLQTIYATENLDFWETVENLKQLSDYELTGESEKIYNQFVAPDAPEPINLPDYIHKELNIGFRNKYYVNSRTFFDNAQKSIYQTMENDSWNRFVKHEQFNEFLKAARLDKLAEQLVVDVQNNNIVEVAKCLAQGAPATWVSPADLKTPLHFAATKSDILVAQLLILNGAQIDARDNENKSPLWYAEKHNKALMLPFLAKFIANGSKVRQSSEKRTTLTLRPRRQNEMPFMTGKVDSKKEIGKIVQQTNDSKAKPSQIEWRMTDEQKTAFKTTFRSLATAIQGKVFVTDIKPLFVPKISEDDWNKIFTLADVNGDGMMEEEEFCILHFLFDAKIKGIEIPATLPTTLRPEVIVFPNGDKYIGGFNKEGQYHGKGRYIYANGASYAGTFANGQYNGWGTFIGANGDRYEGHFKDDKYHGKGKCSYANGDAYQGEFFEGERHGVGVYTYANGNKYEGNFKFGECNGRGSFTYTNGDKYEGDFKNGEYLEGSYLYANGDRYKGSFLDGKPDGTGVFFYANGDKYEGQVSGGNRDGKGKYIQSNGNIYEGEYVEDVLHGTGYYLQQGNRYEGTFQFGKANGYGRFFSAAGDRYEGEFFEDLFHGNGICHYADGSIHEGQYAEGKRHGKGRLVKPNGDIFVGVFQSDMMIKGIYTWKSGERYEGDFKNGVPHGKGKFIGRDGKVTQGEFTNGVHVSS